MEKSKYDNAVKISHILLKDYLKKGMSVVDMTAGNGLDSLFLLEQIGKNGHLVSFDIQDEAINKTKVILKKFPISSYDVINDSHHNCYKYLKPETIYAVIFNLGYLPGGNKNIKTESKTTIKAIDEALKLLKKNGAIYIVIYHSHDKGKESSKISEHVGLLDQKDYNVFTLSYPNQKNDPAKLTVIEKR